MNANEEEVLDREKISNRKREWSELELAKLIRRHAGQLVTDRRRYILKNFGAMTISGRVDFSTTNAQTRVMVDYTDLGQFLESHFAQGDKVSILIVPNNEE